MAIDSWGAIDQKYRQAKSKPSVCAHCQSPTNLEKFNIAPEGAAENMLLLCVPCIDFHKECNTAQWFWSVGSDPFNDNFEVAASREEAISAATEAAYDAGFDTISICFAAPFQVQDDVFDSYISDVFTWWRDNNGDVHDCIQDMTTISQDEDLASMLNATFRAWRLKHRIGKVCAPDTLENVETIELNPDDC
jgi:hypothetical protein